jgi:hypothetical protein
MNYIRTASFHILSSSVPTTLQSFDAIESQLLKVSHKLQINVKVSSLIKFHFSTLSQIKENSSNNSIHDLLNESNLEAKFHGVLRV